MVLPLLRLRHWAVRQDSMRFVRFERQPFIKVHINRIVSSKAWMMEASTIFEFLHFLFSYRQVK